MTFFWTILTIGSVSIVGTEWMLWCLFHRRIEGLHLHLSSTTGRRVFTVTRIRVFTLLHTTLLLGVVLLSLFFLW